MCKHLHGRSLAAVAVLVLAACTEPTGAPETRRTASFVEPGGCNTDAIYVLVDQTFTGETRSAVGSLVNHLCTYKEAGDQSNATWIGYQILDHIAIAGSAQSSPQTASELALAVLRCMTIGETTLPASLAAALSPGGAFAVRGFEAHDSRLVASAPPNPTIDFNWVLEPPSGETWRTITTLDASATSHLADSVAHLFLAFGEPSSLTQPEFTHDIPKSAVFDWATIPTATFDESRGGVIVGICDDAPPFFIQHQPVGQPEIEILGFVSPACPGPAVLGAMSRGKQSLFAGFVRFFTPTPAYAALATTGTAGGKGSLSPFGKVDPGAVNLSYTSQFMGSGYVVNKFIAPTISVATTSNGGTPLRQGATFAWFEAVTNRGVAAKVCNNYAFSDSEGRLRFPKAYFTKAGGYKIITRTIGIAPDPHGGFVPTVPPGDPVQSPIVNVKNSSLHPPAPCLEYKTGDPLPPAPGPNG